MKLLLSVRLSVHLLKAFLEIYLTDFSDFFFHFARILLGIRSCPYLGSKLSKLRLFRFF